MKRSQLWFMIEGVACGILQVLVVEFTASVYYTNIPFLRIAVPILGVILSTVSFYFLMRRFPGMKLPKYVLGVFAYAVILPAWFVYRSAFRLIIFPQRTLAEGDGTALLQLLGVYVLGIVITRAVIVVYFYIRKKRRKKASRTN